MRSTDKGFPLIVQHDAVCNALPHLDVRGALPAWIPEMDVYCDYRKTTPASAGEMKLAAERHAWSAQSVLGDPTELVAGTATPPSYRRHAFFRSIGLGLEDVAIAYELFRHMTGQREYAGI